MCFIPIRSKAGNKMRSDIFIEIILSLATAFLILKLVGLYVQIHRITKQLDDFISERTHKILDVSLSDPFLESMAANINRSIYLQEKMRINEVQRERAIRDDIANISHDLRTPLTAMIGYLSLSKEEKDFLQKSLYIDIALQKAMSLQSLVDNFFEMSYIDSDACQIQLISLDVNKIIRDELLASYCEFENHSITPLIELPEHPVMILGNELAIERIIQNLIANAISYSTGQIEVCLKMKGEGAELIVRNSSHFISDQEREKIFDRFYRASTERISGHAGLGLYIAKQLILKQGGSVRSDYKDGMFAIIVYLQSPDNG